MEEQLRTSVERDGDGAMPPDKKCLCQTLVACMSLGRLPDASARSSNAYWKPSQGTWEVWRHFLPQLCPQARPP